MTHLLRPAAAIGVILNIAVVVLAVLGCGGSDPESPAPPSSYQIIATTPSSGGAVQITPGCDGKLHVQPWQEFDLHVNVAFPNGTARTAAGLIYDLTVVDSNGIELPPYGKGYRSEVPGQYIVTATVNPGTAKSTTTKIVIVVDPLAIDKVHFSLVESMQGDTMGSYWDSTGFWTYPGVSWVFMGRWSNDLVPGVWSPESTGPFDIELSPDSGTLIEHQSNGICRAAQPGQFTAKASQVLNGHLFNGEEQITILPDRG